MRYMKLFFLVMFFQSAVPHIANATSQQEQIDFLQEALRSTQTLLDECRFREPSAHSSLQAQALNDLIDQLRRIPENQELFEVFDMVQSLDLDNMSPEELCGGGRMEAQIGMSDVLIAAWRPGGIVGA